MGRVIAVANQKGGVGKTTTAVNLSACLAEAGKRVLLVEVDPQGNAADASGHPHRQLAAPTIYEALWGRMSDGAGGYRPVAVDEAIRQSGHGYDLLPANNSLAAVEWEFTETVAQLAGVSDADLPDWAWALRSPRTILRDRLAPILSRYDVVIIDCPPSLGLLTVMALVAATEVMPVVQSEYLASSFDTALDFTETVDLVRGTKQEPGLNPGLTFTGVVINMFDGRRNHDIRAVQRVKEFWGPRGVQIFSVVIGRSVAFADATEHGRPAVLDSANRLVAEVSDLAREVFDLA